MLGQIGSAWEKFGQAGRGLIFLFYTSQTRAFPLVYCECRPHNMVYKRRGFQLFRRCWFKTRHRFLFPYGFDFSILLRNEFDKAFDNFVASESVKLSLSQCSHWAFFVTHAHLRDVSIVSVAYLRDVLFYVELDVMELCIR
jgi:hypothetical protein